MSKNNPLPKDTEIPSPDAPGGPGTPMAGPELVLGGVAAWERYKWPIVGGVVLLLVALIGSEVYRSNQRHNAEAASAQLAASKTIGEYQKVIDDHPGTLAAANAYLLLARDQIEAKDFAGAAATWQTFVEKFPKHPQAGAALLAQGNALEAQGKLDEARAIYQRVASSYANDYAAPQARLCEATLLKSQRKLEEARRVYDNIIATYPNSVGEILAREELRYLNALPPLGAPAPTPRPSPPPVPSVPPAPVIVVPPGPTGSVTPTPAVSPASVVVPPGPTGSAAPTPTASSTPSPVPSASPAPAASATPAASVAPTPVASTAPVVVPAPSPATSPTPSAVPSASPAASPAKP